MEKIDSFRGSNYYLSNFYSAKVEYDGITYENTEAAFQAQKCINPEDRVMFSHCDPSAAKKLGRRVKLRPDWEEVKYVHMKHIVKAKFEQNPDLAAKLIATGDAHLEEGNTWGDRIWGTVNGVGNNALGLILMQVRDELKSSSKD